MKPISVHHMSGAGNRFLVGSADTDLQADEVKGLIDLNPRTDDAPIEGVLLLREKTSESFTADFYNPDGSRGMMCGNGARCIVRFAVDKGVNIADVPAPFTLNDVEYRAVIDGSQVTITFPPPISEEEFPAGELEGVDATGVLYGCQQ